MILVTPSKWLKYEVGKSYLKDYSIEVINNGVDTNVFKPTLSNIKQQYGIGDKKVILGVSSIWNRMKGLDTFIELSKEIDDQYQLVLIGLNKKQVEQLPCNIIGISRTENVQELVKWYSAAYIFLNPTLEDTYPTTNLEAIACGTPVVTFNTGGSPESAFAGEDNIIEKKDIFNFFKNDINLEVPKSDILDFKEMNRSYLNIYSKGNGKYE